MSILSGSVKSEGDSAGFACPFGFDREDGRSIFLFLFGVPSKLFKCGDNEVIFAGRFVCNSLLLRVLAGVIEREDEAYDSGFLPRGDCDRDGGVCETSKGSSLFLFRERLGVVKGEDGSADSAIGLFCEGSLRDVDKLGLVLRFSGEGRAGVASCSFLMCVVWRGVYNGVNDSVPSVVCICDSLVR
jgi:hypothetical protein